jgi:hypothetical protein
VRYPIDLRSNDANLKELLALVRAAEQQTGEKCVWVIVDTLSRAMAGGDENSPVDMGRIVAAADRIRAETSAHFTYLHHTGKDAARGARGHSLLRAATDTEIEVASNSMTITKQRDMEGGFAIGFGLVDMRIGDDHAGNPIKSAVVEWKPEAGNAENPKPGAKKPVPPSMRMLMEVTGAAIDDAGKSIKPFHDGPLVKSAPETAIRSRFDARVAERAEPDEDPEKLADRQRKNFRNAIKAAIEAGSWNGERWIWIS